jgi:hypothetical protein
MPEHTGSFIPVLYGCAWLGTGLGNKKTPRQTRGVFFKGYRWESAISSSVGQVECSL